MTSLVYNMEYGYYTNVLLYMKQHYIATQLDFRYSIKQ